MHLEIRKEMSSFLKKNKKKKFVILDIPLLLENKINKKNDILIFVQASKTKITKRLRKRLNYNNKILEIFKNIQLPLHYKRKKSKFVIKNNFSDKSVKKEVKKVFIKDKPVKNINLDPFKETADVNTINNNFPRLIIKNDFDRFNN